jgi:membrane protease YdiL (CAAX protease family)
MSSGTAAGGQAVAAGEEEASVRAARRQVGVFLAVTFALSYAFEAWILRTNPGLKGTSGDIEAFALMWIPGLVATAARLFGREGFADAGWRLGAARYWLWACAAPLGCALLTYGLSWAVGVVSYVPFASASRLPQAVRLAAVFAVSLALIPTLEAVFALGEELGWRGYLLTRLIAARVRQPLLIGGLIWGFWHLPLILWGGYASSSLPWLSALLFLAGVTFSGIFAGWLRLASGSVWMAVLYHASHNAFYQVVLEHRFKGPRAPFFAGEAGLFSILAYGLLALWLWRSGRLRRVLAGGGGGARAGETPGRAGT